MSQILSKSRRLNQLIRQALSAILMLFAFSSVLYAQEGITVRGTVIDDTEEPLIGASPYIPSISSGRNEDSIPVSLSSQ